MSYNCISKSQKRIDLLSMKTLWIYGKYKMIFISLYGQSNFTQTLFITFLRIDSFLPFKSGLISFWRHCFWKSDHQYKCSTFIVGTPLSIYQHKQSLPISIQYLIRVVIHTQNELQHSIEPQFDVNAFNVLFKCVNL